MTKLSPLSAQAGRPQCWLPADGSGFSPSRGAQRLPSPSTARGLPSFVKGSWEGAILTVIHRGSESLAALGLSGPLCSGTYSESQQLP